MNVRVRIFYADVTVLNKLRHLGLRDVWVGEDEISFKTSLVWERALRKLLRNHEFEITRQGSILDAVVFLRARSFLVVCLVAAVAVMSVMNNFVFRIEVRGLDEEQTQIVSEFLRESGVRPVTLKRNLRAVDFAPKLIDAHPFIAHASTQIRGNRLVFNIYPTPHPPQTGENDLLARFDAVVEEIVVLSGVQMVQAGQSVLRGQTLVRAVRRIGDIDEGQVDEMGLPILIPVEIPTRAVAIIRGRVVCSAARVVATEADIMMTTLELINQIQNQNPGVTFLYSEQFVTPLEDGAFSVEVSLSSGVIDLLR